MTTQIVETPTAGKPKRRRQEGSTDTMGMRLPIPDWVYEKYPKAEWKFYWFRDEPGRIKVKHGQDWDVIDGIDPVPGATDQHGNPCENVLCRKRIEFWDEDKARLEERRKQIEGQMERGNVAGSGDDSGETLGQNFQYDEAKQNNRLS